MNFIFKHFNKIFATIFILAVLISVGTWVGIGYVAVKLGPKAINAADKALD